MNLKHVLLASSLALCGLAVQAKPFNVCLQPSDRIVAMADCDAVIQPTPELDPSKSAKIQSSLGSIVIGWIGGDQEGTIDKVRTQGAITPATMSRAPALIQAMSSYSNIQVVYVADEFGHCDSGDCLYEYIQQLSTLTSLAHAAGKKVLLSVLPGTLAAYPDKVIPGINEIDGIAVVVYASFPFASTYPGCAYTGNPLVSVTKCSFDKLERMGWSGTKALIVQGFALTTETDAQIQANLALQRELVQQADSLNIYALMYWGCYLGQGELRREPTLMPLCGTKYEALLK